MRPAHAATHAAALAAGVAAGYLLFHNTAPPTPATTPAAPASPLLDTPPPATAPPNTVRDTTSPTPSPPAATTPSAHTPAELARRYALLRDFATQGGSVRFQFHTDAFQLSPRTADFLGLDDAQSAAVTAALDSTLDAVRTLESENSERISSDENGTTVAVGDLSEHIPALEQDLRDQLAAAIPAEDLALLDHSISELFKPLRAVREIRLEPNAGNERGYRINISELGDHGKPYNTLATSTSLDADPANWRRTNPKVWRFSHLVAPGP